MVPDCDQGGRLNDSAQLAFGCRAVCRPYLTPRTGCPIVAFIAEGATPGDGSRPGCAPPATGPCGVRLSRDALTVKPERAELAVAFAVTAALTRDDARCGIV